MGITRIIRKYQPHLPKKALHIDEDFVCYGVNTDYLQVPALVGEEDASRQ